MSWKKSNWMTVAAYKEWSLEYNTDTGSYRVRRDKETYRTWTATGKQRENAIHYWNNVVRKLF